MSSVAAVVEAVAGCVESRYVDEAAGARAAAALRRKLGDGGYDDERYAAPLAVVLTHDLQAVLPDLHLQVRWSGEPCVQSTTSHWDDPAFLADYWAREALDNHGFDKAERLPGNVGLIVVRGIDEPEGTASVVDAAFAFLSRCSALIIDLRRTTGGAPSGVAHFLGHLLPSGTALVEVRDRAGSVLERTSTSADRQPTLGNDVPVFVLTGRRTVSACEELVYDLRAAGRATLIGAPTAGAANPVDVYTVDPHVAVRVPTAVVRHAQTGGNWEGAGIVPDVVCALDDALDVAHRLALDEVRLQVASGRIVHAEALLEELDDVGRELDEQLGLRQAPSSRDQE
jgi:hypothetical protein